MADWENARNLLYSSMPTRQSTNPLDDSTGQTSTPTTPPVASAVPEEYRFENLTSDQELQSALRTYFRHHDSDYSDTWNSQQLVDRYVSNRRWVDSNTTSLGGELYDVAGGAPDEVNNALSVMRDRWERLPAFWQDGGQGLEGLISNVWRGVLDPIAVATGGASSIAARAALKGIVSRTVAGVVGGVAGDAAVSGAGEYGMQSVDIDLGRQDSTDWTAVGAAALIGGAASTGGAAVGAQMARAFGGPGTISNAPTASSVRNGFGQAQSFSTNFQDATDRAITNLFNRDLPIRRISEDVWGMRQDPDGMQKFYRTAGRGATDLGDSAYARFRRLPSIATRFEALIRRGGLSYADSRGTSTLYQGLDGRMESTGSVKLDPTVKSLNDIMRMINNQDEWEGFLIWRAARRVDQERGRGKWVDPNGNDQQFFWETEKFWRDKGFSAQQAHAKATRATQDLIDEGNVKAIYQEADVELDKLLKNVLDIQYKAQLINEEGYANMLDKIYIPFYQEELDSMGNMMRGRLPNSQKGPARSRTGDASYRPIMPFTDAIMRNISSAIVAADTNLARLAFVDEALQFSKGRKNPIIEAVKPSEFVGSANIFTDGAASTLRGLGFQVVAPQGTYDPATRMYGLTQGIDDLAARDGHQYMVVYRDGKGEVYRILDDAVAASINSYKADVPLFMENAMAAYARFSASMITKSPLFIWNALRRGTISSAINSNYGYKPVYSMVKGMTDMARHYDDYVNYLINGGGMSSKAEVFTTVSANSYAPSSLAGSNYLRRAMNTLSKNIFNRGWRGYGEFINNTEHISRFAEYRLARKYASSHGAALAGRDVDTDFSVRGTNPVIRRYAGVTMFLQAGISSLYRAGQKLRHDPKKAFLGLGGIGSLVIAPELASYVINKDFEEEYSAVPDAIKDTFFLIPNVDPVAYGEWALGIGPRPQLDAETPFIPIPKPYDYAVFGNMLRSSLEAADSGGDAAAVMLEMLLSSGQSMINTVPSADFPTFLAPIMGLATNKDWKGSDIVPPSLERLEKGERIRSDTSELALTVSDTVGGATEALTGHRNTLLSPASWDYLMERALPGIAALAQQAVSAQMRDEGAVGERPTRRGDQPDIAGVLDDYWGIPRFLATMVESSMRADNPIRSSQNVQDVYGMYRSFNQEYSTFRAATGPNATLQSIQRAEALRNRPEHTGWMILRERFSNQIETMFDLQTTIRRISNTNDDTHARNAGMSLGDWKRQSIDSIQQRVNDIAFIIMEQTRELAATSPEVRAAIASNPLGSTISYRE